MKTIVMGDVHRDWPSLNKFTSRNPDTLILQCGDFGYWPRDPASVKRMHHHRRHGQALPAPKVPDGSLLFWCDGNHEDHQELGLRTTDELWPNVHYMPRGRLLDLPDGRRVMFMGGATSIDKESRTPGIDWFPEEAISDSDIRGLNYEGRVDIVISHTAPREFDVGISDKDEGYYHDCSRMALSYVLHHYHPALWYFGHWHWHSTGYTNGCRWTALNYPGNGHWQEELRT